MTHATSPGVHATPPQQRRLRAFTLVELLVVIAIISVLAAMLLPLLDEGIESAHKVACANNNRQLYLAWTFYLDDFQGRMPAWETDPISLNNGHKNGNFYHWYTNSSLRIFLRNYAGANVGLAYKAVAADANSIIFCPSRHDVVLSAMSYSCNGVGVWTPDVGVGSPLITRMAQGWQSRPVMFMEERLWSATVSGKATTEGPHRHTGGYITLSDGSLKWHPIFEWWSSDYISGITLPVYRQAPAYNYEDWFRVSYNQQNTTTYTNDAARDMRRKIWGYRK